VISGETADWIAAQLREAPDPGASGLGPVWALLVGQRQRESNADD